MKEYTDDLYAKEIGRKDEKVASSRMEGADAARRALRKEAEKGECGEGTLIVLPN